MQKLSATRRLTCEIVYVDDGSRDDTLAVAKALPATTFDVQVISLSRNFGKEAALLAGLDHARLGAVLFIDGDGQHPPDLIETLVGHWLDGGYDVVFTAKAHRDNESALRRIAVKGFYALINWGARQKIPPDAGDFRLLSPRAVAALRRLPERNRFFKGLATWIGFRQIRVDYNPAPRAHGKTSWGIRSLIGLSVEGLTSFSVAPLRVASLLGLAFAATALFFGIWMLIEALIYEHTVPGYSSLIVAVLTIGGVQLLMIGVMGEYIGKILSELKARPVYFVAEHEVHGAGQQPRAGNAAKRSRRMTRVWLVADDYGISKSVNRAIRDLLGNGRLSATSVMTVAPAFDPEEIRLLQECVAARSAAIGLHLTLTAPFAPLSPGYRPTKQEKFLPLGATFVSAFTGRLDRTAIAHEVRAQIAAFAAAFGHAPDFIDGHQHIHLLPPVADSLLAAMLTDAPGAWVRQCGRAASVTAFDRKALVLDLLSKNFRGRAARFGIRTNTAFAGTYDFRGDANFEKKFAGFLERHAGWRTDHVPPRRRR